MKTRKAILTAPRTIEIVEEELPKIGENDILVRLLSSGLCHTEVPPYIGINTKGYDRFGNRTICENIQFPTPIGHEPVGIVEAVGSRVTRLKEGDYCAGITMDAFSEYLVQDNKAFFKLPKDTRDVKHCILEPIVCCTNIVKMAEPKLGDYVAVVGCGLMGLLSIAGLKNCAHRELIAIDVQDSRLELAKKMGATVTINPAKEDLEEAIYNLTNNQGCDVVVEITGSLKGLRTACTVLKHADLFGPRGRGKLILPSVYAKPETWDPRISYDLMFKSPDMASAHMWHSYNLAEDIETSIWAYQAGIMPIDELITHEFALDDISVGFEKLANGDPDMLKGIVVFD